MLIDDATHLAMIRAVGGVCVTHNSRRFWAIFDARAETSPFGDAELVARGPQLTARSCDVVGLVAGDRITVGESAFVVSHKLPDGTGITVVALAENEGA
jgi:hypothetical protein